MTFSPKEMKGELERELGNAAYRDAYLQFSGKRLETGHDFIASPLRSRPVILGAFRQAIRRFPRNNSAGEAEAIVKTLEKMIEEDGRHPVIGDEALAKRSVEEQVAEWIFRLRDQCGRYDGRLEAAVPERYVLEPERAELPDPARALVQIGTPAVAQLLAALGDERLSRCVRDVPWMAPETKCEILSVGNCAALVLSRIAGRRFTYIVPGPLAAPGAPATREEVTQWWGEVQAKGERQTLVDALAGAQFDPSPLVTRLAEVDPDAVEDALIAGALRVKDGAYSKHYINELGRRNNPRTTDALLAVLDGRGKDRWLRIPAAVGDRGQSTNLDRLRIRREASRRIWLAACVSNILERFTM